MQKYTHAPTLNEPYVGGLSKPRPVKSVIGLFRRESFGSQSQSGETAIGSDPTLASHLNVEMQAVHTRTPIVGMAGGGSGAVDRRSGSICGPCVVQMPICETAETDELGWEDDDDDDDDEDDVDNDAYDEEAGACGGKKDAGDNDDDDDRDPLGALSRAISERMGDTCGSRGGIAASEERRRAALAQAAAATLSSVSPSIAGGIGLGSGRGALIRGHYASPYAVTASHRRHPRRGSMMELNG